MQDLSNDQITQVQQYLKQNPSAQSQVVQQLQSKGFNIPSQISTTQPQSAQPGSGIAPLPGDVFKYQPSGNAAEDVGVGSMEAAGNLITSAPEALWNLGKGVASMATGIIPKPGQFPGEGIQDNPLVKMAVGGTVAAGQDIASKLTGKNTTISSALQGILPQGFLNWVQGDAETGQNILNYYNAKYLGGFKNGANAGFQNIMNSVVNDPWGTALDISAMLSAGSSIAGKVGQVGEAAATTADEGAAAEAGQTAAQPAQTGNMVSRGLEKAATWANPLQPLMGLGGKIVEAIGNKLAAGAANANDILDSARNITAETGVGIEDSLTQGMKGGKISRMLEAVAGSSIGATSMIRRMDAGIDAVQQAASDFGKGFMSYLGVGSPEELWSGVKNLQSKVFNTETNEFKASQQAFKDFKAANGDTPVDMTPVMDKIAEQTSAGVKSISDSVQGWLKRQTKVLTGALSASGGDPLRGLLEGGDENMKALIQSLRQGGQGDEQILSNTMVKTMAENQGLDIGKVGQAGAALPFEQAHNFYMKLGNAIADADGTDRYVLNEIKKVADESLGGAMKGIDPKLYDAWKAVNATLGSTKEVTGSSVFKTLTNAGVDSNKVIDAFFGKNSRQVLLDLKGVLAPEDFRQFTVYGLAKQALDAFSDIDENDPVGKGVAKFKANIDKIGMPTLKAVLDPDIYANLDKAMNTSGDFETLIKQGIRGAQKLSEGSRTTPLYQGFRYVRALEGVGAALMTSGGNWAKAATDFVYLLVGDVAFSKFIASDMGQKMLGIDVSGAAPALQAGGQAIQGAAANPAMGAGMRATTIAGQVNTQPQGGQKQLSPQQISQIQQRLQTNPNDKSTIMSTLQQQGYDVSNLR